MKKEKILRNILIALTIIMIVLFIYVLATREEEEDIKKPEEETEDISYVNDENIKLDLFDYFKMENHNQNMIYSPLSINYAINMLYDGAANNTRTQLDTLRRDLTKYNNYDKNLNIANGLFIKPGVNIKESYINGLKSRYNAEVYNKLDITEINSWVKKNTLGLIDKAADELDPSTVVFLVNALAIDMEWEHPFESGVGMNFNGKGLYQNMKNTVFSEDVLYSKEDNAVLLPLKQYGDTKLEVMLVMPENLPEYINNLTEEDIAKVDNNFKKVTEDGLTIVAPKFKYDYQLSFKEDLIKQGITDMFSDNADFTNMSDGDLSVTDAIHKATIDFSTEGVKAAAITGISFKNGAVLGIHDSITFDKPFMYIIRDSKTKNIWFIGKVYEPTKMEESK